MIYPNARIQTLVLAYFIAVVRITCSFLSQLLVFAATALMALDIGSSVAYWAHIDGFIAGMILVFMFARYAFLIKCTCIGAAKKGDLREEIG